MTARAAISESLRWGFQICMAPLETAPVITPASAVPAIVSNIPFRSRALTSRSSATKSVIANPKAATLDAQGSMRKSGDTLTAQTQSEMNTAVITVPTATGKKVFCSEKKPRMKGSVIYGFTVKTNGKVTNIKRVGGTLRDDSLTQCSVKVLEAMRFPKPRKQSVQVKVPIQYKRT